MELTEKQKIALLQSIEHWEKDIQSRLKKGDKVVHKDFEWASDGTPVKCCSENCSLCQTLGCRECPYKLFYKKTCTNLHWGEWQKHPNLKTCNELINALKNILKDNASH